MRLLVVSYKECWLGGGDTGFVTVGGFPHQMEALSTLFTETRLMIVARDSEPPAGTRPIRGHRLGVEALPEPAGRGIARKLALLLWLPRHVRRIWRAIRSADAVHALVPGDVGVIGLLLALTQRKPLWVRHCGTWGNRQTISDRFIAWLLPRVAGGRVVVAATGGGQSPPSPGTAVKWIFSTALGRDDVAGLRPAAGWWPGEPLRLVQVGRLTAGKNAASTIRAMPAIRRHHPRASLAIAGDGPLYQELAGLVAELQLDDCVTLHGNLAQGEVLRLLERCHVFVFPTRVAEGFPKAVLEAMACGVPILVPPVSVLPHLVAEGAGHLLAGTEPDSVARGVLALTEDPDHLAELAHRARRIARRYTLEKWLELVRYRLEEAWGPLAKPPNDKSTASATAT